METLLLKAHGLTHEKIEEIVGVTGTRSVNILICMNKAA